MQTYFITGASGNVGAFAVKELLRRGHAVRASVLPGKTMPAQLNLETVEFTFADSASWEPALAAVHGVFLMRPPHISNIKRDMLPFMEFLKERAIPQTVFMSVQGAETNPWVPHFKVEKYLEKLDIPHSLIRPSFFMQNLTTTHLPEIRHESRLFVPAGKGRTNFIDAEDIANCAVEILLDEKLQNKAYTVTGLASFSYQEIADQLTKVLGKTILYKNPGPFEFLAYHAKKRPLGMSLVMLALYSIIKFGKGDITTDDTGRLLGRPPKDLTAFLQENRHLFV